MSLPRTLGLLTSALLIVVTAVSGQQPPKTPPGTKTTDPKTKPADPKAPDTKTKNPMVPAVPALPPKPPAKKDDIKWPPEINGRKLSETIKDMRGHSDPAVRETSVRALPFFGPEARKQGVNEFLEALTKDNDWNVRIAAVDVAPTILVAFADEEDTQLAKGLNTIANLLSSEQLPVRFAAVAAVGNVGPYMRKAEPRVIGTLSSLARMQSFYHMRTAAVGALGRVGQAQTADPDNKIPPDSAAVSTLLDILKTDPSAAVRREAVNSLLGVGVVAAKDQKTWRATLDNILARAATGGEKDKSVLLWIHVLIIRNDPNGLKGNESHLDAIVKLLDAKEAGARLEACQALGFLGEEANSKLNDIINLLNKEAVPEVAAAAIAAMTSMPKESAITIPVLTNVSRTHVSMDVRKLAEEAIKFLNNPKKN